MINIILNKTKKIEYLLEKEYDAVGRGLHEKLSSVEYNLEENIVRKIRKIATIRNKAVHEIDYKINNLNQFIKDSDNVINYLTKSSINSYENSSFFKDKKSSKNYKFNTSTNEPKGIKKWWKGLNKYIKWLLSFLGFIGILLIFYFYWEKILGAIFLLMIFIHYFTKEKS